MDLYNSVFPLSLLTHLLVHTLFAWLPLPPPLPAEDRSSCWEMQTSNRNDVAPASLSHLVTLYNSPQSVGILFLIFFPQNEADEALSLEI